MTPTEAPIRLKTEWDFPTGLPVRGMCLVNTTGTFLILLGDEEAVYRSTSISTRDIEVDEHCLISASLRPCVVSACAVLLLTVTATRWLASSGGDGWSLLVGRDGDEGDL